MSGTQVIRSAPSHADESAHGLAPFVKGLWAAYWQSRARRASVVYLNSLDNRTLDDIGLDRSEIEFVRLRKISPRAAQALRP